MSSNINLDDLCEHLLIFRIWRFRKHDKTFCGLDSRLCQDVMAIATRTPHPASQSRDEISGMKYCSEVMRRRPPALVYGVNEVL